MMDSDTPLDLVILGSGMAGLAAARQASANGLRLAIVDKGRRIGGRVSTRRADGFTFNHGAQFLTARQNGFTTACDKAVAAGALQPWQVAGRDAYCGVPTMRDFPDFLGGGLDIRQGVEITGIEQHDGLVALHDSDGGTVTAHQAVITAPAPQAMRLLATVAPGLSAAAASAAYAPCWTAMFGFDSDMVPDTMPPIQNRTGPVGWAMWECHRPGQAAITGGALTVQAAPDWSADNLEEDSALVAKAILAAWQVASGLSMDAPAYQAAHRWRYARVTNPADAGISPLSDDGRIAVAGDWLAGARVEDAYMSGLRAVTALADAAS